MMVIESPGGLKKLAGSRKDLLVDTRVEVACICVKYIEGTVKYPYLGHVDSPINRNKIFKRCKE